MRVVPCFGQHVRLAFWLCSTYFSIDIEEALVACRGMQLSQTLDRTATHIDDLWKTGGRLDDEAGRLS